MLPVGLIPAYKPSKNLVTLMQDLRNTGMFHSVICVNDGSGVEYDEVFDKVEQDGFTVLRHAINLGKGNALKTGINYIAINYPETVGIITLDADGQHLADDCVSVAKALKNNGHSLVLGVRRFDKTNVPLKSRVGNIATRYVTKFFTGLDVIDTQTGLRGIPQSLFGPLLKLNSGGYDFEMDMLITACESKIPVLQVPIETVYIDNNSATSFDPFWDSVKIYMVFLRFNLSSVLTFAIDCFVFSLVFAISSSVAVSIVIARLFAGSFNYIINKEIVFKSKRRHAEAILRYAATVFVMGLISYGSIVAVVNSGLANVYLAKIVVESILFVFSFIIQRDFVFTNKAEVARDCGETDWCSYYQSRGLISKLTSLIAFASFKKDMKKYAPKFKSLVELGGANTIFYSLYKKHFPNVKLMLVDKCPLDKSFAKVMESDENTNYLKVDILSSGFQDKGIAADCVVSFGLVEHFNEKDTLEIIARHFSVAKPGGIIYISFPTPTCLYIITRRMLVFFGKWQFHDERPLKFEEVSNAIKRHGNVLGQSLNYRLGLTQGVIIARKFV